MDNEGEGFLVLLLIGIVIWSIYSYFHIQVLNKKIISCSDSIVNANNNISASNNTIENAKNAQWEDYESMGYAIDNLEPANQVSNPCEDDSK